MSPLTKLNTIADQIDGFINQVQKSEEHSSIVAEIPPRTLGIYPIEERGKFKSMYVDMRLNGNTKRASLNTAGRMTARSSSTELKPVLMQIQKALEKIQANKSTLPVGSMSRRSDGSYEKQGDGSWAKVKDPSTPDVDETMDEIETAYEEDPDDSPYITGTVEEQLDEMSVTDFTEVLDTANEMHPDGILGLNDEEVQSVIDEVQGVALDEDDKAQEQYDRVSESPTSGEESVQVKREELKEDLDLDTEDWDNLKVSQAYELSEYGLDSSEITQALENPSEFQLEGYDMTAEEALSTVDEGMYPQKATEELANPTGGSEEGGIPVIGEGILDKSDKQLTYFLESKGIPMNNPKSFREFSEAMNDFDKEFGRDNLSNLNGNELDNWLSERDLDMGSTKFIGTYDNILKKLSE